MCYIEVLLSLVTCYIDNVTSDRFGEGSMTRAKQGYTNLTGIDYCSSAIDLSRSICEKEELSESVHLEVTDFLTTFSASERFDVCLDKGTFDAVSLDPDGAAEMRRQYVQALCRVMRPEGLFIITSCNWTKQELVGQFEFEVIHELPTPTFHFGGHAGKSVTALAFKKKRIRDSGHTMRIFVCDYLQIINKTLFVSGRYVGRTLAPSDV
uniref:EEF1A lysine methyltransferase 2 n=1 Tax=Leptobrachium leishanense TaxID=445787 RepID=A0A8C5QZR3_9ANUR